MSSVEVCQDRLWRVSLWRKFVNHPGPKGSRTRIYSDVEIDLVYLTVHFWTGSSHLQSRELRGVRSGGKQLLHLLRLARRLAGLHRARARRRFSFRILDLEVYSALCITVAEERGPKQQSTGAAFENGATSVMGICGRHCRGGLHGRLHPLCGVGGTPPGPWSL